MANIKEVVIEGFLQYDANGNKELIQFLGMMNTPTFGIRITYDDMKRKSLPNKHGGQTMMYAFRIYGMEAVRDEWIKELLKQLGTAATVSVAKYRDYENNEPFGSVLWAVPEFRP